MKKLFLVLALGFSGVAAASQLEVTLTTICATNPDELTSLSSVRLRDKGNDRADSLYLLPSGHVLVCTSNHMEVLSPEAVISVTIERKKKDTK